MLRHSISRPLHQSFKRQHSTATTQVRRRRSPLGAGLALSFGVLTSYYFFFPDASRGAPTSKYEKLSPSHFTPCTVTSSEPRAPNARLITLSVPQEALPSSDQRHFPSIWSVFVKDDDIQVERPYTPLEGIGPEGEIQFWIKKYPNGEVGRWLHSKEVGDQVEIRGPLQTWLWKDDNFWDEVVMISGGTGVAPFYQLFYNVILSGQSPQTRFTLLHSSRSPLELPPSEILRPLYSYASEHPARFRIRVFVDKLDAEVDGEQDLTVGRINKDVIESTISRKYSSVQSWMWPFSGSAKLDVQKTLFLVCGPEPMIAVIAGPHGRNFSQGPVGGILADLGATLSQVYKL
ncbi:hypothetical protein D9757_000276 [Collybiopsis confluens]|uniref:FAD-binding FR-type domain-containing protein n=1 Tax=Collybiopsis confluens TaxID=2823264 RepID=A0A8H5MGV1_9AGAR|nr:hypothetical protein D9757_000276 [Collybiopsis confluens]